MADEMNAFQVKSLGSGRWQVPGLVDTHVHLAWTDFDAAARQGRSEAQIEELQLAALAATVRAGVTAARDAGGLTFAQIQTLQERESESGKPLMPRLELSQAMFGPAQAALGAKALAEVVEENARTGAKWLKVMGSGSLGQSLDQVLDPVFTKEQFRLLARLAGQTGLGLLVHAWGGPALDWAIEAGAASVEHGIALTKSQAERMRQNRVVFVPTVAIYRLAADPANPMNVPAALRTRAQWAAEQHPKAVWQAYEAGVEIALGSDFGERSSHGRQDLEMAALESCGLSRHAVWEAATCNGARLLARGAGIAGRRDYLILDADPLRLDFRDLRNHLVEVIIAGRSSWKANS
jgi:imidazolonepropionase-like amidohydrolase